MSAEIINSNNPVYFTYARNSDQKAEWKNIADVVPDLLQVFKNEGVKYSVDVEDIKNGAKISDYEREIGNAQYVIIVLSDRYFYRYHCMFELYNVLKNTNGKTLKFIKSGNFDIRNIDYRAKIKEFWLQEKAKIDVRKATYINPDISELEQAAIDNNYYLDFIDSLSALFNSVSYTNADNLRKKLLGSNASQISFVTEVKKDLGWRPPQTEQTTKNEDEEPTIKIKERHILYALVGLLAIIVVWMGLNREPKTDELVSQSDTSVKQSAFVDLGLSVLWASCNLGANNPWESGDYYTWDDAKNNGLEMPTVEQFQELLTKCQWSDWITDYDGHKGVNGYIVSGNGNSIFLPAAGWKGSDGTLRGAGSDGFYWSSSLYSGGAVLYFDSDRRAVLWDGRFGGFSVRAVRHRN